jgi:hypothetical protein
VKFQKYALRTRSKGKCSKIKCLNTEFKHFVKALFALSARCSEGILPGRQEFSGEKSKLSFLFRAGRFTFAPLKFEGHKFLIQ